MRIQLKRSSALENGRAKEPSQSQLEYGEIAVNFNDVDPAIFFKDSSNAIVRVTGDGAIGSGNAEIEFTSGPGLYITNPVFTLDQQVDQIIDVEIVLDSDAERVGLETVTDTTLSGGYLRAKTATPTEKGVMKEPDDGVGVYMRQVTASGYEWVSKNATISLPPGYPNLSDGDGNTLDNRYLNKNIDQTYTGTTLTISQNLTVGNQTNVNNLNASGTITGNVTGDLTGNADTADLADLATNATNANTAANLTRSVIAGDGLTGGGELNADRTLDVGAADATIIVEADGIRVDQNNLNFTAAAKDGQINISASNGLIATGSNATANQSGNTTRIISGIDATTSAKGVVKLNDSVNSTSTTQAATANAARKAYNRAEEYAPSKTGANASGTWDIDISGNAATADVAEFVSGNVATADLATNAINIRADNSTGNTNRPFIFAAGVGSSGDYIRLYRDSAATCFINPNTNTIGATNFTSSKVTASSLITTPQINTLRVAGDGNITIQPNGTTQGRSVNIYPGIDDDGIGGSIVIGKGTTDGSGGHIYFRGNGGADQFRFAKSGQTNIEGFLSFESLSADRTYTFPNSTGTIALTSSTVTKATTADNIKIGSNSTNDWRDFCWVSTNGAAADSKTVYVSSAGANTVGINSSSNRIRAAAFQLNAGAIIYPPTQGGSYGNVYIDSSNKKGNFSGINLEGAAVFMRSATTFGLYDDTNNKWAIRHIQNQQTDLYYNGSVKISTATDGISVTGATKSSGVVSAGGSKVALNNNDGYGNANLIFNHIDGKPMQDGSSARITSGVDGNSALLSFQVGNNTKTNTAVALTEVASITTGGLTATKFIGPVTGNADSATVATNVRADNRTTANGNHRLAFFNSSNGASQTSARLYLCNTIKCRPDNGTITATTFSGSLNGNASGSSGSCTGNSATATKWKTARTLWGVSVDGSANKSGAMTGVNNITGANATMTIQPADSTTARTLYLRGNNDTNGAGGGTVIGHQSRGQVWFMTGAANTGYRFYDPGRTDRYGALKFDNITANRTYTFPNETGTVALTSSRVSSADVATYVARNGKSTIDLQGQYMIWNRVNGTGATFFCNQKGGGSGGWRWCSSTTSNVDTEIMRLEEDRELLFVGGSGAISNVSVVQNGDANISFSKASGSGGWLINFRATYNRNTDSAGLYRFWKSNVTKYTDCYFSGTSNVSLVFPNGGTVATTGSSDGRLKTNVVDATSQWDTIKQLRFVNFNYKADAMARTADTRQFGVIGQEAELLIPEAVSDQTIIPDEWSTELKELIGESYKEVDYRVINTRAVKALQEAMERIEALETKVAALEG